MDDITEIERISAAQVLYDEIFARAVNDVDWLLPLPRKIHYKTSNPSVAMKQKLKFYIPSLSTEVMVNKELYNVNAKYDLSSMLEITTRSHEGTTRDYRLHTLNYGEFKTFSVAGVEGSVQRTEYDYSYYEINMSLPRGTDLSNLVPTFTLYGDNEQPYIGDVAQESGVNVVDFSSPVTYRFVVTDKNYPEIKLESTCKVTLTVD